MLAKHTPGLWTVRETTRDIEIRCEDEYITIAAMPLKTLTDEESFAAGRADARLIAAAPDLLAACKEFLALVGKHDTGLHDVAELAKAAIAKATGADQ